ncbi:hypothetical protein BC567DRAFT_220368 [Phyllosticta citribraziliensis]
MLVLPTRLGRPTVLRTFTPLRPRWTLLWFYSCWLFVLMLPTRLRRPTVLRTLTPLRPRWTLLWFYSCWRRSR